MFELQIFNFEEFQFLNVEICPEFLNCIMFNVRRVNNK